MAPNIRKNHYKNISSIQIEKSDAQCQAKRENDIKYQ